MRLSIFGLTLALGFVLALLASAVFTPNVQAGQSAVKKWQYKCIGAWNDVEEKANAAGAQGWELVAVATTPSATKWCFKRPLN